MIRHLKRYGAAFLATLAMSLPASATTYSTDYTDLWWNANESGWGVNLIQQYETIFATLFVYGNDGSARWYVASALTPSGGSQNVFTGSLYQTTGPYFGAGSFTPPIGVTPVGTMTLNFNGTASGTLSYSVNGVNITKAITRQNWRDNVLTGRYVGGLTANGTSCRTVPDGPIFAFELLNVAQNGTSVTMTVTYTTSPTTQSSCTFSGTYTPSGRLASINGSWSCSAGNQGTFSMPTVEASANGFNPVFIGSDQYCTYNGYFGGVHDIL